MRTGLPQPFGRSADVLFGGVQQRIYAINITMEREPIYTCGGNAAYSNGGLRIRIMEPDAGDTTCTFRVSISTASLHGECTAADLRAIAAQCLEAANELDPQP